MTLFHASQRTPDKEEIEHVLAQASKHSTFQVVYVHWGIEYDMTHSTAQRELAETFVDAGADLIVGHHPHVTQDIDIIKGVVVVYSPGILTFVQYASSPVHRRLLVGLAFKGDLPLTLTPVTSKETLSQPTYMKPKEHQLFLENLANRSHPSLREKITSGSIPLLDTVATSTKVAMM